MLPPSPDRFPPRLQEIRSINQIRLDLVFNEDINFSALNPQSFLITSPDNEAIRIRTVSRGVSANIVTLYTQPLPASQYLISGTVTDRYDNIARINRNFRASVIIDTLLPSITRVLPKIGTTRKNRNISFEFSFSEPIDTTRPVSFVVYPLDKNRINWQYSGDWQSLTFGYSTRGKPGEIFTDSLEPNTNVYFMLLPNLTDLSGNRLQQSGYTFFTTESILSPIITSGTIFYQDRSYADAVIIFSSPQAKVIAVSDPQGDFAVRLDSLVYSVTAIKDTNFDNLADLYVHLTEYNPLNAIPLKLILQPIKESQELDYYLR